VARIKGPRKVGRYTAEFKLKAVKLSQIDGVRRLNAGVRPPSEGGAQVNKNHFHLILLVFLTFVLPLVGQTRDDEKEHSKPAIIRSESGDVLIGQNKVALHFKVGSRSGAEQLLAGIAILPAGSTIPTHLHEIDEELIYVVEGEVKVTLNGQEHKAVSGDIVFVPPGTWMAITNPTTNSAKILGVIPRAEMEECMRVLYEDSSAQKLQPEQLHQVCRLRSPESEGKPH
jgi:quercetin dioxygenase-like cupin family protein